MSTEWIQIVIACAVIVPLIIITGRYLRWRRWDRERRELRQARRQGLAHFYGQERDKEFQRKLTELEVATIKKYRKLYNKNPGFSVKT